MQKSSRNISSAGHAFYLWHAAVPLVVFASLILTVKFTDLDRRATELFYDASISMFPLRDDWLLQTVEHVGAKRAVILLAVLVIVAWLASHGLATLKALRPVLFFIFVSMALSVLSVSILKNSSSEHCPYDLPRYGGVLAEPAGPFETVQKETRPGRCWPSGHASAGFCLFAWYFAALRLEKRRLALYLLSGVIVIGSLLSAGRVAQGAHFVSHCLWSAAVCWFVTLALYEALLRRRPVPSVSPPLTTPHQAAS